MKNSIVERAQSDEAVLELGKALGQSLAFGIVAGRCSAAQAVALRQVRSEKVYRRCGLTWKQFCPKHLRMSGTQADEIIRLIDEFGPEYFEHTETVRISADTYRLVAPFIQDKSLRLADEVLELNSANVQRVANRLRESQRALPAPAPQPAAEPPAAPPSFSDRVSALDRRAKSVIAEFREVASVSRQTGQSLMYESMFHGVLLATRRELQIVSNENGLV